MSEAIVADIRRIAQEEGVDPDLAVRVAKQESGFRQDATSRAGARGIMQLMPDTAKELGVDLNDPMQNIRGGVRYLGQQQRAFGSPDLALAAYNAGPGRVREYLRTGRALPQETQNYVSALRGAGISPDIASVDYTDASGNIIVSGGERRRQLQPGEELLSAEAPAPTRFTTEELAGFSPELQAILRRSENIREAAAGETTRAAELRGQLDEQVAAANARVARQAAEAQEAAIKEYASQRKIPPEFSATPESAGDLSSLFGLLGVFGTLIGGGGKQNALAAMNAMTGMMQGWRQGRQDLYNREKQTFDTNVKQLEARNTELRRDLENAIKIATTNMDAGMAEVRQIAARTNSQILLAQANAGNFNGVLESLRSLQQIQGQIDQYRQRRDADRRDRIETELRRAGPMARVIYEETGGAANNGVVLDQRSADGVRNAAVAMAEGASLADYVNRNPFVVGRPGQFQRGLERTFGQIGSLFGIEQPTLAQVTRRLVDQGRATPNFQVEVNLTPEERRNYSLEDQQALLFAKRFAAYQLEYERALQGRGVMTVYLQQRFNRLTEPNQFTPEGFIELMREHTQEVARRVAIPTIETNNQNPERGSFGFDTLRRIGARLHDQGSAGTREQGSAQRGFSLLFPPSRSTGTSNAPAPSSAGAIEPPQNAIRYLRDNLSDATRRQFDEVYGDGAAERALRAQ